MLLSRTRATYTHGSGIPPMCRTGGLTSKDLRTAMIRFSGAGPMSPDTQLIKYSKHLRPGLQTAVAGYGQVMWEPV